MMREERDLQEGVHTMECGVPEAVRDDDVGASFGGAVGAGDACVGDLEPAVPFPGDRPGPQPALVRTAGSDVRPVAFDDLAIGNGKP